MADLSLEPQEKLFTLILSGGQSKRMGRDKGLIATDHGTWIQNVMDLAHSTGLQTKVSIRKDQLETYAQVIDYENFSFDQMSFSGPLNGLLSAHVQWPERDILLLACDMPNLSLDVLEAIVEQYLEYNFLHEFFVFLHASGEREPMCGIYTCEGLRKIYSLAVTGQLSKHSLKHILELGNTMDIQIKEEWVGKFLNVNEL